MTTEAKDKDPVVNSVTTMDDGLPQGRMLTDEDDREMKESLAREKFGMSLDEFAKAWRAGEFDDDQDRHGDITFLAMMLPEYWEE